MKVFIESCHASLEYDHARMFMDLGCTVGGAFDLGSSQRPKIPGATDSNSEPGDYDVIVLHQVPEFDEVAKLMLNSLKKPIFYIAFGQGDMRMHENIAHLANENPNLYVIPYAIKEYQMYKKLGVPEGQLELIRFGKYLDEYGPWVGDWKVCYTSCNSIHKRGEGCAFYMLDALQKDMGIPFLLSGNETEEVPYGVGQLKEPALRNAYKRAKCYFSPGTTPAPLTMTLIEALCSGTPVVAYDNLAGIAEEELGVYVSDDIRDLATTIYVVLNDNDVAREMSEKSIMIAKQFFDINPIKNQWKELLEKVAV